MSTTDPIDFITSHCRRCAAGWTRTNADGETVTVCLLDRQPVWKNMTFCDRFEAASKTPTS